MEQRSYRERIEDFVRRWRTHYEWNRALRLLVLAVGVLLAVAFGIVGVLFAFLGYFLGRRQVRRAWERVEEAERERNRAWWDIVQQQLHAEDEPKREPPSTGHTDDSE